MGDRFYLCENKILCEYDYEERLAFANMALQTPASLAYIKRQLPPTPTPPGQNMHPGHNPLQAHQGLGQSVVQHNHMPNVSANVNRGVINLIHKGIINKVKVTKFVISQ